MKEALLDRERELCYDILTGWITHVLFELIFD